MGSIWLTARSLRGELRGRSIGRLLNAERRRAPRVKCYDLVKWIPEGELMNHRISNLHDISISGLRFGSRERIRPETILRMILNIAETGKRISVLAQVVWSRALGPSAHQAGAFFVRISNKDRAVLAALIPFAEKIKS